VQFLDGSSRLRPSAAYRIAVPVEGAVEQLILDADISAYRMQIRFRQSLISPDHASRAIPGPPYALVLPAVRADPAMDVPSVGAVLEVVSSGCRQGGLESGYPPGGSVLVSPHTWLEVRPRSVRNGWPAPRQRPPSALRDRPWRRRWGEQPAQIWAKLVCLKVAPKQERRGNDEAETLGRSPTAGPGFSRQL
jgi:hypothetical protein